MEEANFYGAGQFLRSRAICTARRAISSKEADLYGAGQFLYATGFHSYEK